MTTSKRAEQTTSALADLESYYDAVPRRSGRAEEFGALTLFVREDGGAPYYARPTLGGSEPPTAELVQAVRARQRELGVPEAFEWVAEVAPGLRAAVEEAGLKVSEHPLLALGMSAASPEGTRNDVEVRMLDAEDRILPSAVAVQYLAFAEPGTACGGTGLPDLAEEMEARVADGTVDRVRARLRAGATMFAAAVVEGVSAVSAGQHNPVGAVSEIVGVATLPAHRRQGLGLTVTAALVADARARGVRTVFLSAEDHDVMRIYTGLGFERVGTALVAGA